MESLYLFCKTYKSRLQTPLKKCMFKIHWIYACQLVSFKRPNWTIGRFSDAYAKFRFRSAFYDFHLNEVFFPGYSSAGEIRIITIILVRAASLWTESVFMLFVEDFYHTITKLPSQSYEAKLIECWSWIMRDWSLQIKLRDSVILAKTYNTIQKVCNKLNLLIVY